MAFAKGRAFVILNRMAESGNSEAKKILSNLNSMSQEDLDSKLSTLFGKGGTSKEGDTAPKDEKGGKAPEGKEEAPKGKETSKLDKNGDLPKEVQEQKYGKKYVREFDEATEYKENLNKERKESLKEKGVFVDDKEFEEASKEMKSAKDGIKPIQYQKDFNPNDRYLEGIGQQAKDYLGKRKFMTEPNSEVQREIDSVMQGSESNEDRLAGIAALKEKYEDNKVNLAALDKLEQEIEQEDSGKEDYFKLEDEFETMVNYDGTNSMEVVSQLKEKYKGDATKQQALDKLEGKEKFREATKEYLENNKETSPLWAKSGMTGNQKLWDAERVRDAMYDFINDEPTIEAALAEARSVFEGSKGSEEFINYLEQKLLGNKEQGVASTQNTDAQGSASNPMTSATEGIKAVETNDKQQASLKEIVETFDKDDETFMRKGSAFDGYNDISEKPLNKIPQELVKDAPEFSFEEVFGKNEATPLTYYTKDFASKGLQYFVLKDKNGNKFLVDTQGYDYSRYYAPVDATKGATPVEGGKTVETEGIKPVEGGKPAETKGELYNDFTKKLDVYLGKKEEDAPELKSLKEKASQEAVALVDKYTFDNPKDGEDLDYLVSVYLPYISLAYANYKWTDVPLASNKANTLEDFIKTRNASEIGRFVKVSTGIAFQKDDVSYTKRAIETMQNTMKAKKG